MAIAYYEGWVWAISGLLHWLAGVEMVVQLDWIRSSEQRDCAVIQLGEKSTLCWARVPGYLVAVGYCPGCPAP